MRIAVPLFIYSNPVQLYTPYAIVDRFEPCFVIFGSVNNAAVFIRRPGHTYKAGHNNPSQTDHPSSHLATSCMQPGSRWTGLVILTHSSQLFTYIESTVYTIEY